MSATAGLTNSPQNILWLLTSRCNLACRHCYAARFPQDELPEEEALRILKSASRAGVKHLALTGGEVFLHPNALEILSQASELGMSTSMVSNGLLITEEAAQRLKKCHTRIFISLDGARKDTHERVRGRGTWEPVISAIEKMHKHGIECSPIMAVSKLNRTEVREYLSQTGNLGSSVACLIPVMPAGRATRETVLEADDMVTLLKEVDETAQELEIQVSLWCTPFARLVVKSDRVRSGFCRLSQEIELDPMGNVLLCDILDLVVSNVQGKEVKEIWEEQEQHPLVRALSDPVPAEPCRECPLQTSCQGGCFARAQLLSGNIHDPDPLCPRVSGAL